jgi:lipoprotein NlpD
MSWCNDMKSRHLPAQGQPRWTGSRIGAAALVSVLLGACATGVTKAPVEQRSPTPTPAVIAAAPVVTPAPPPAAEPAPVAKPVLAGAENAGKPGFYTVKPGDTLIRIALDNGQNWRDVARWSGLDNPNIIEVGQVLRVVPPGTDVSAVASTRPVAAAGKVETKPLDPRAAPGSATAPVGGAAATPGAPAAAGTPGSAAGAAAAPTTPTTPAAVPAAREVREADDDVNWAWPATGAVATGFDDAKSKGLAFVGKAGDPVFAAADGRVVYAGSGLRGYGNLVIVKHNTTYLTAYAHNQSLLVKEDQVVRRGQKIAEMGSTDAERVQLHFEIRRQGKPIDPARLLPPR